MIEMGESFGIAITLFSKEEGRNKDIDLDYSNDMSVDDTVLYAGDRQIDFEEVTDYSVEETEDGVISSISFRIGDFLNYEIINADELE